MQAADGNEEIVRRLMDLFASTLSHQAACLEGVGLTYALAKLLWRLEAGELIPLKELARRLGVDHSNAAGVVDQLTERGTKGLCQSHRFPQSSSSSSQHPTPR